MKANVAPLGYSISSSSLSSALASSSPVVSTFRFDPDEFTEGASVAVVAGISFSLSWLISEIDIFSLGAILLISLMAGSSAFAGLFLWKNLFMMKFQEVV